MKKTLSAVILSQAKNLGRCEFQELRRSFLRSTQDRLRLQKITHKYVIPAQAGIHLGDMDPRFRGGDLVGDLHSLRWATGPWVLLRVTA